VDVAAAYLWSGLHDRPVNWACQRRNWPRQGALRRLPCPLTMSRRLRTAAVQDLLRASEQAARVGSSRLASVHRRQTAAGQRPQSSPLPQSPARSPNSNLTNGLQILPILLVKMGHGLCYGRPCYEPMFISRSIQLRGVLAGIGSGLPASNRTDSPSHAGARRNSLPGRRKRRASRTCKNPILMQRRYPRRSGFSSSPPGAITQNQGILRLLVGTPALAAKFPAGLVAHYIRCTRCTKFRFVMVTASSPKLKSFAA
jgi:hypothetical protein